MSAKNALLSVYHKDGIDNFAGKLVELGWTIYSSGGTARHLRAAGIEVIDTADYLGRAIAKRVAGILAEDEVQLMQFDLDRIAAAFGKSIMGHRVSTLWPHIHGGILRRDNVPSDLDELEELCAVPLDLVCVDLYPMAEAIALDGATVDSVRELTDIGGPTLLRAAAKGGRIVICDPADRQTVLEKLQTNSDLAPDERQALAAKVEFTIARYCLASARFLSAGTYDGMLGRQVATCRYGENPQQARAALFTLDSGDPLAIDRFRITKGTAPSFVNNTDFDRLLQTITHIAAVFHANRWTVPKIAVAVKHGNACGAAVGEDTHLILQKVVLGDPEAIFGGVVMTNFPVAEAEAEILHSHGLQGGRRLFDAIVAPSFDPSAVELLGRKGDKCRFMECPPLADLFIASLDRTTRFRPLRGGFATQENYTFVLKLSDCQFSSDIPCTQESQDDLLLAWAVCATSNSNTITAVKDNMLLANATGGKHRGRCVKRAIEDAGDCHHELAGAAWCSDSFFPFPDGPLAIIEQNPTVVFTTTGSVRDQEVFDLFKQAKVPVYSLPDKVARGFFGH